MRVLVISGAFPPMRIGEADHAFHLCRYLAKRKLDVHVLTTQTNGVASDPDIEVYPIMRNWSWLDLPRLVIFLRHCAPDAVLLIYLGMIYNFHPMITFLPTISKILLPKVPFVAQFEAASGALPRRTSVVSRALRKGIAECAGGRNVDYRFGTLLRDSDRIILLSDHHRAILADRFPGVNKKSVLNPPPPLMTMCPEGNGAARQRGREALGVRADEFLVVYFGRIYPDKGVDSLLKAVQLVIRHKSLFRVAMVGGSLEFEFPGRPMYEQGIHDLSKRLGIENRLIWVGEYKWNSDVASTYLHAADLCVLPFDSGVMLSKSSFVAAAAHGLPIISTRGEMVEQPFIHGENVFLCPPKDPEALASAIEMLMDKPNLRKALGIGSFNLAQEWFSWDKAVERTIATFSTPTI